ncbi:MAG: helix-turn-helix transcriptional regulator [Bacilli bacterium]|nr:helix-turn-helix transcriptional regulator [Bacilli bacterium]
MESSRIEIVKYPKVKHIKMFVNKIKFVENHLHNDFEILLTLNGKGILEINNATYMYAPGDIIFINSGDVHSLSSNLDDESKAHSGGATSLFIQISNHFLREYFPQIHSSVFKSGNLRTYLNADDYARVSELFTEAAKAYFSETNYFQLDVVASISKALAYIYRHLDYKVINEVQKERFNRKKSRMERIISYIDANFDSQIRLEDIASKENLSVTHLSHIFSSSFGMTFQEFVNIKRMEQCIRLMANKEKTLLEISYESGFSDSKYMNKMFLKRFGCTPKEYRKKYGTYYDGPTLETGKFELIYNDQDSLKAIEKYIDK